MPGTALGIVDIKIRKLPILRIDLRKMWTIVMHIQADGDRSSGVRSREGVLGNMGER